MVHRYLPNLIYGANDGIVTTLAVMSGVTGAALSNQDVRRATDLMESLPAVWRVAQRGDPVMAHDLVGSIVPEGIGFEAGKIRTAFGAAVIDAFRPKTQNADPQREPAFCVVARTRQLIEPEVAQTFAAGAFRPSVPRSRERKEALRGRMGRTRLQR